MTDDIDKLFESLDDYYPGSKRKRRAPDPKVEAKRAATPGSWDSEPQVKTLASGKQVELFSAGALALALNRPLVTLRLWERKGYIPRAPYRLKSMVVDGVKKPGWRMYSRAMIEVAMECFQSRGLLDAPRIDWNRYPDLSIELMEKWDRIHSDETAVS